MFLASQSLFADAPTFRWVQQAGGTNVDYSTGVTVDALGNTFVSGRFTSSNASFGGIALSNGPIFLAKIDANGGVVWAKGMGSDLWYYAVPRFYRIAADGLGGVFIGGTFESSSLTIDGITLTNGSSPYAAAFLARFDGLGQPAMARIVGTNNDSITADAVASDGAGNVFLVGRYYTAVDLGLTNSGGGFYAAEFNANGNLLWAKSLSPVSGSLTQPLALVPLPDQNFLVGGWFTTSTATFDAVTVTNISDWSFFLVKYDAGRNVVWAKAAGLTTPLAGLTFAFHGDAGGNIYVLGNTGADNTSSASITLDGCTVTNKGDFRFIFKLAPDGQVLWCRRAGDFTNPQISSLRGLATDCDVDALGNCYITGEFAGYATFDHLTFTNVGGTGAGLDDYPSYFLAKMSPQGNFVWAKAFGADDWGYHGEPYSDWPSVRVAATLQGDCSFAASLNGTNTPFDGAILTSFGIHDALVARIDADPPRLSILCDGNSVVMSWPNNQPGFVLECSSVLSATNSWSVVTNEVTVVGAQNFVTNSITAGSQFYRLRKQ